MFRRLRVKLTVLYAGLFCAVLVLIGATAYAVIASNTQTLARTQMASTGAVFDQLWRQRLDHLRDGAFVAASQAALQENINARDDDAVRHALAELSRRVRADLAFVVTREGLVIGEGGVAASVPPGVQAALARERAPSGVMRFGESLFQSATAPIPGGGWVVVGVNLDDSLGALEKLASIPLQARALTHGRNGWSDAAHPDHAAFDAFVGAALQREAASPELLRAPSGEVLILVKPLPALDGARSVVVLRYPLSMALSAYAGLFGTLVLIALFGLALLVVGTWLLARGITQPLSTLEEAAKHLREGVYDTVVVGTKDELSRLAESFNAMIEAIRERERRITQLAYHDGETRLPNRAALERNLARAKQPERIYLAAIGVDRFTHVRGAIGYTLANALIRTLGQRLLTLVPNAPLGRVSSDVLAVAFLAADAADARRRAGALISNLEQPLSLDGQVVDVTVTIGVAQPRVKGESPAAMIDRASVALDQARAASVKAAMFDEAAYGDPARNLSLMGEMRAALENGDMTLAYQPKYDFRSGRITSAECLVRWRHPTRGMIAPDLFVPMAEETGQVRTLTEWSLRRAVADQKRLAAAGWPLTFSVNISARLLSDADFAEAALEIVRQARHQICFEITETAVIDNPKLALESIERFAASGVRIAIDDYGSGLSSLSYLKQLPAQELKIDKLFVQNITNSQRDALLVRSTIDLAHGLGMEVVAEGVETPAAFALLAQMRCDHAQGYLVARPSSVEELAAILADETRIRFYQQTAAVGAAAQLRTA